MRIDAHQHFWRYNADEYGWIDDSMAGLRRDFLPADLKLSAGSSAHLELRASNFHDKLELDLPVTGPELLTQLTIDKPVYRAGDRLFFRSVTSQKIPWMPTTLPAWP